MIRLDRWQIQDFDPGRGPEAGAAGGEDDGWIPVSAPGDTYLALVQAGRLKHPWRARAETEAAWVRDREWWWRTTFDAPPVGAGEVAELVFEGPDTFASIYLDGALVGRTDNMFRRYVFDVDAIMTIDSEAATVDRKRNSLEAIAPPREGRRLVIFAMQGCKPCKQLSADIELAVHDRGLYDVSMLVTGDVVMRTNHIRLGARTYPTVLLVENNEIAKTEPGYDEEHAQETVSRYLGFLKSDS